MRVLSRSYSAPRELEHSQEQPLLFRSVALLYPWKEVLERIRRDGNQDATLPHSIPPMFDEDGDRRSPLASNEKLRVLIAQDNAGVSLSRLLFDSHAAQDTHNDTNPHLESTRSLPRIMSPPRASQSSKSTESSRPSPFLRHQPQKPSSHPASTARPKSERADTTSSPAPLFGQSSHSRRLPAYLSLADARNDGQAPIEGTKAEMDSWLDCMFGKSQMRYKGENTKLHIVQRQPSDPRLANWDKDNQRGASELCPERNAPLLRSRPDELVKLRKSALLLSRTFTVSGDQFPLPEQPRRKSTSHANPTSPGSGTNLPKSSRRLHYSTPTFAVAVLLPIASPLDGDELSMDHVQLAIDNWHSIARALHALENAAVLEISLHLKREAEALTKTGGATGLASSLRMLNLKPSALQGSERLLRNAESASERITRAFCVIDVAARNEWNIWRDELRDITKSAKGSDAARVTFVQVAMTAALTSNLSWMRIFAPPHLQPRLRRQARKREHHYDESQNRLIVVTSDHNRARQMIYLLSMFMPMPLPQSDFARSLPAIRAPLHVSALTQGLKAVSQDSHSKPKHHLNPRPDLAAPTFTPPLRCSPSTSPMKPCHMTIQSKAPATLNQASLQRMKSRIDIQGKCTPAMPIASAPGSSYTTPAASPDARPSSSASAQRDLMHHLQRNNSALSESSTESGSFWNSLRSTSWSWGIRRESATTNTSGSDAGAAISASQRGEAIAGILKTGKTSMSRSNGKKLVRMAEDAEDFHSDAHPQGRKDSGITTPTPHYTNANSETSVAFSQVLEYSYDATESIVDVQCLGQNPSRKNCKVPVSDDHFPLTGARASTFDHSLGKVEFGHSSYDRVAGYLERPHPDFALQAVKPNASLEHDIKEAMRGERSPKQDFSSTEPQSFPTQRWVEVCSTMVIDVGTMSVKRLTLRRHNCYTLIGSDDLPIPTPHEPTPGTIKITKSDEMDSVKRTYRRNDNGKKVDWKDKKVLSSNHVSSSGSGEDSLESSYEQLNLGSSDSTVRQPTASNGNNGAAGTAGLNGSPMKQTLPNGSIGDDLTAFIDESAKAKNKSKPQAVPTATRRIAKRNAEGKITGWRDVTDDADEPGLHDLPAGFSDPTRQKIKPAVHERMLEEVFTEEVISKPDPAVISLLDQALSTGESRSAVPSRAGSVHTHSRTNSRSNSICGSGLTELQLESKKVVEDALEGLVISVASEKHNTSSRSQGGGLFGFRQGPAEASILRQTICKWLTEE